VIRFILLTRCHILGVASEQAATETSRLVHYLIFISGSFDLR